MQAGTTQINTYKLCVCQICIAILERLPQPIQAALVTRAAEVEYPVEAFIEMAIASFLDTEALGFADCQPGRGN